MKISLFSHDACAAVIIQFVKQGVNMWYSCNSRLVDERKIKLQLSFTFAGCTLSDETTHCFSLHFMTVNWIFWGFRFWRHYLGFWEIARGFFRTSYWHFTRVKITCRLNAELMWNTNYNVRPGGEMWLTGRLPQSLVKSYMSLYHVHVHYLSHWEQPSSFLNTGECVSLWWTNAHS